MGLCILGSSLNFSAHGWWGKEKNVAALLVESRTPKKSFVFLLEEKIRRAQNKKCRENFFAGWRALASGGGATPSEKIGSTIWWSLYQKVRTYFQQNPE